MSTSPSSLTTYPIGYSWLISSSLLSVDPSPTAVRQTARDDDACSTYPQFQFSRSSCTTIYASMGLLIELNYTSILIYINEPVMEYVCFTFEHALPFFLSFFFLFFPFFFYSISLLWYVAFQRQWCCWLLNSPSTIVRRRTSLALTKLHFFSIHIDLQYERLSASYLVILGLPQQHYPSFCSWVCFCGIIYLFLCVEDVIVYCMTNINLYSLS